MKIHTPISFQGVFLLVAMLLLARSPFQKGAAMGFVPGFYGSCVSCFVSEYLHYCPNHGTILDFGGYVIMIPKLGEKV
jgi:hypothetical protein